MGLIIRIVVALLLCAGTARAQVVSGPTNSVTNAVVVFKDATGKKVAYVPGLTWDGTNLTLNGNPVSTNLNAGVSQIKTQGVIAAMSPTKLGVSNTVGLTWGAFSNLAEITYFVSLDAILSNFLGAPPPTNANAQQWSNLGTNNISNLIGATQGLTTAMLDVQGATNGLNTRATSIESQTNTLGSRATALESRATSIESQTNTLGSRATSLESQTNSLGARVSSIEGQTTINVTTVNASGTSTSATSIATSRFTTGTSTSAVVNATSANITAGITGATVTATSANITGTLTGATVNATAANISGTITSATHIATSANITGTITSAVAQAIFIKPLAATASRAAIIDPQGILTNSPVTTTELALLSGKTSVADNTITNGLGTDKVNVQSGTANSLTSTNETVVSSQTNQVAFRAQSSSGYGRSTNTIEVLGPVGETPPADTNLVYLGYGILTNPWPVLKLGATWSNANVTFTAFQVSMQDKGSTAASKLIDAGTNNGTTFTSKFSVDKNGNTTNTGAVAFGTAGQTTISASGNANFGGGSLIVQDDATVGARVFSTYPFRWNSRAQMFSTSAGVLQFIPNTTTDALTNQWSASITNASNGRWVEIGHDNIFSSSFLRTMANGQGIFQPLALGVNTNQALLFNTNHTITVRETFNTVNAPTNTAAFLTDTNDIVPGQIYVGPAQRFSLSFDAYATATLAAGAICILNYSNAAAGVIQTVGRFTIPSGILATDIMTNQLVLVNAEPNSMYWLTNAAGGQPASMVTGSFKRTGN